MGDQSDFDGLFKKIYKGKKDKDEKEKEQLDLDQDKIDEFSEAFKRKDRFKKLKDKIFGE